jgi:pantoate--beta-alanine ligase
MKTTQIKIITSVKKMQKYIKMQKQKYPKKTIGFVPTMGALHKGHISLFKKSLKQNDINIVSIYVNKTQFNNKKDYENYPNTFKNDLKICNKLKVNIVFAPKNLYFDNSYKKEHLIKPSNMANSYEGVFRVGHFDGMLRVVLKLINIISPTKTYFGKKDAQQLCLIKQMKKVFFLSTKIIACDCVRDKNNLAISSRNIYILKNEKQDSLKLNKALFKAKQIILSSGFSEVGVNNILNAKKQANKILKGLNVEYFDIVDKNFISYDDNSQNKKTKIDKNNIILIIAIKFKKVRLIDSLWV